MNNPTLRKLGEVSLDVGQAVSDVAPGGVRSYGMITELTPANRRHKNGVVIAWQMEGGTLHQEYPADYVAARILQDEWLHHPDPEGTLGNAIEQALVALKRAADVTGGLGMAEAVDALTRAHAVWAAVVQP